MAEVHTKQKTQFRGIDIPSDPRILDLFKIIGELSKNSKNNLNIILSETGNLYIRGVVKKVEAENATQEYFNEHGDMIYCNSELFEVAPSASVNIQHSKRFEDGLEPIQLGK